MRDVLERSSARETTVRVACGALAKVILRALGVEVAGHVRIIGGIEANVEESLSIQTIQERSEASPVRCLMTKQARK